LLRLILDPEQVLNRMLTVTLGWVRLGPTFSACSGLGWIRSVSWRVGFDRVTKNEPWTTL